MDEFLVSLHSHRDLNSLLDHVLQIMTVRQPAASRTRTSAERSCHRMPLGVARMDEHLANKASSRQGASLSLVLVLLTWIARPLVVSKIKMCAEPCCL